MGHLRSDRRLLMGRQQGAACTCACVCVRFKSTSKKKKKNEKRVHQPRQKKIENDHSSASIITAQIK